MCVQSIHIFLEMPGVTARYCSHSCLNYCIFTKLSQIVCLIDVHILKYQHAECGCWLWNCIFGYFSYITTFLKRYNYIKQISQKLTAIVFSRTNFHRMCVQYTYMKNRYARCDYKIWNTY